MINHNKLQKDNIVRTTVLLFLPLICLYSLYIQVNGEISPGGGFQAGVIMSVAYILFLLAFGVHKAEIFFPSSTLEVLSPLGVLIYAVAGIITMLLGGKFLDYNVLHFLKHPQHVGLFVVELGVGICVFGSISLIIFTFYVALKNKKQLIEDTTLEHNEDEDNDIE